MTQVQCLSIQQPWAAFFLHPELFTLRGLPPKTIENRAWSTNYRGKIYLHTGKHPDPSLYDERRSRFVRPAPSSRFAHLFPPGFESWAALNCTFGGVVGTAVLADVLTQSADPWFVGPYGFLLTDIQAVPFVPLRGKPALFEADVPAWLAQ